MFGNPFVVKSSPEFPDAESTLHRYEQWLRERLEESPDFAAHFDELAGQRLWCPGCGLDAPMCHARVIERVLEDRRSSGASQA
jgi:hypothetical protein